jgi:hypothetical protein
MSLLGLLLTSASKIKIISKTLSYIIIQSLEEARSSGIDILKHDLLSLGISAEIIQKILERWTPPP